MSRQEIYPRTSPYHETSVVEGKFLDVMKFRPIPKDPSDAVITITAVYENRPDLLAFDLYGDARLWWVFAVRNQNRLGEDPYFNFTAGTTIYVPRLDTLKAALGV